MLVAVTAMEVLWLVRSTAQMEHSRRALLAKRHEVEAFARETPALTLQNADAIVSAYDLYRAEASGLKRQVLGGSRASADLTAVTGRPQRTETFFDLARFVDEMRKRSATAEVTIKENEYFGFATYANMGPPDEWIDAVVRQRNAVQELLEELFSAGPARLENIRRERPRAAAPSRTAGEKTSAPGREADGSRGPETAAGDFFVIEPELSLRRSGKVDTLAFRVAFAGETACLREFLNRLAASETPWWVRAVDAGPEGLDKRSATADKFRQRRQPLEAGIDASGIPAVPGVVSLFMVTLERIETIGTPPVEGML